MCNSQGTTFQSWSPPSTVGPQIEVPLLGLWNKLSCWAPVDFFQSPPRLFLFTLALKSLSWALPLASCLYMCPSVHLHVYMMSSELHPVDSHHPP